MAYILLGIFIKIISFYITFSVQFDVCVRWPNYGVRYHNDNGNYCFVDLTTNLQFEPFLFKEAVDFCKFNGGIVDISFPNGSHRALLNKLLSSDVGRLTGVNETIWRFTRGLTVPDHDCSQSYTIQPGCEVVCAFKSCPPGSFGHPECQSTCGCKDVSSCDIATGSCSETECAAGFFGPPACRKCNCNMNTGCDNETGECPLSCQKGWRGKSCQKRMCRDGKCPALARFSRQTPCQNGWSGDDCQTRLCPEGFYGVPNCNETCSCPKPELCSPIDGECGDNSSVAGRPDPRENPCQIGWTGDDCQTRICPEGFYGVPDCTETCSCPKPELCSPIDGKCGSNSIVVNRPEPSNSLTCPPFSYGSPACDLFCFCYNNTRCHPTTGICPGICVPGWTGNRCDERLCRLGFYSYPDCNRPCACLVAESCNALTGDCELDNCKLWNNCTGPPQPTEAEDEPRRSIFWYLIIAIVGSVLGTVALLAAFFFTRKVPANESLAEI
ncbi:hypothetical protein BsWGS_23651 [Bradybaena similaris]